MYFFWVQAGKLFFGGAEEGNTFLKINFNNKYFLQQIIPLWWLRTFLGQSWFLIFLRKEKPALFREKEFIPYNRVIFFHRKYISKFLEITTNRKSAEGNHIYFFTECKTMATLKTLRKQCEEANLLHKKCHSYQGSFVYWCKNAKPFHGKFENDDIIANYIKAEKYVQGVDYVVTEEDYEQILKEAKSEKFFSCIEKFQLLRYLKMRKVFFEAYSKTLVKEKNESFYDRLSTALEKHSTRTLLDMRKLFFVAFYHYKG